MNKKALKNYYSIVRRWSFGRWMESFFVKGRTHCKTDTRLTFHNYMKCVYELNCCFYILRTSISCLVGFWLLFGTVQIDKFEVSSIFLLTKFRITIGKSCNIVMIFVCMYVRWFMSGTLYCLCLVKNCNPQWNNEQFAK